MMLTVRFMCLQREKRVATGTQATEAWKGEGTGNVRPKPRRMIWFVRKVWVGSYKHFKYILILVGTVHILGKRWQSMANPWSRSFKGPATFSSILIKSKRCKDSTLSLDIPLTRKVCKGSCKTIDYCKQEHRFVICREPPESCWNHLVVATSAFSIDGYLKQITRLIHVDTIQRKTRETFKSRRTNSAWNSCLGPIWKHCLQPTLAILGPCPAESGLRPLPGKKVERV